MPFTWFRDEVDPALSTLVDGSGGWTIGPNPFQSDDLIDRVDLGVDRLALSSINESLPLDAQCDGSRVFLAGGTVALYKDGLTCKLQ
jgi:hypothetical protein